MTEEEKQAIETVKQYKKCFVFETVHEETGERLNDYSNAIDIVLNLIDKQRKELEELKENQIWSEATIEGLKTDFIHKDKIREILQIEGNADIETYLKTIVAENNRLENIEDDRDCNYVSKDKIREVIGTPYPEIAIDNLLKLLEE